MTPPDLPTYPPTEETDVEWLSEVPKNWEMRRLRIVLHGITERNRPELPLLSVVREKGVVLRDVSDLSSNHNYIPDDLSHYKVIRAGQFAINKMKAWQGSYGVSPCDGIVSPAYHVYAVNGVDSDYFHLAIRSRTYVPYFTAASDGVRVGQWDLSASRMREIPFLVPPCDQRDAIVRFLDHADRRIRRYICAKQQLIQLLEEQKQAIIHQAVTGQIDVRTGEPYMAYKDSGIDWLGDVPAHWRVVQLRRVTLDRCDGPFGSGLKSSHYADEGVRVVRLQNIGHGEFRSMDAAFITQEHCATLGDHSVVPSDVLIAGLGDANHPAGRACVAPRDIRPAMVKADCFRFRLDQSQAQPRFVALQLTATANIASGLMSTGATRQRINLKSAAARAITMPEIQEQTRIVESVSGKVVSLADAQDATRRAIDFQMEFRTRLVSDLVTGKLDVREAAALLPEVDPLTIDQTQVETLGGKAEMQSVDSILTREATRS